MSDEKIIFPHEMTTAHVIIKCQTGFEKQIIENLKNIEGIKEINRTIGTFDLLVKLVTLNYDSLKKMVRWKILKIDHIESTTTLLCIRRPLCATLDQCKKEI